MEAFYKREMKHNYLMIRPGESKGDGFELRMASDNRIEGLLHLYIKWVDDSLAYCYEITSKQPLKRMLEQRYIRREEIAGLINRISQILTRMETFLLGEDQILLEPEFIYVEPDRFEIYLCLVPGRSVEFSHELSELLRFLLAKVDHQDQEAVVLAYGLYQESLKDNYGMENLLSLVIKQAQEGPVEAKYRLDGETDIGQIQRINRECGQDWDQERGQEKKQEQYPSKENRNFYERKQNTASMPKKTRYGILGIPAVMLLIPAVTWAITGMEGVKMYRYWLMGAEGLAAAYFVLYLLTGNFSLTFDKKVSAEEIGPMNRRDAEREEMEEWRMKFDEDERREEKTDFIKNERDKSISGNISLAKPRSPFVPAFPTAGFPSTAISPSEFGSRSSSDSQPASLHDCGTAPQLVLQTPDLQTVLLTQNEQKTEIHALSCKNLEIGDIFLTYYPFIIGKQNELVDYVLDRDTVSRLHVRIDKEGEEFRITDLNSTNGTCVCGRLLQTNETVNLHIGDKIFIADIEFFFT